MKECELGFEVRFTLDKYYPMFIIFVPCILDFWKTDRSASISIILVMQFLNLMNRKEAKVVIHR